MTSASDEASRCLALPQEVRRRRGDETGVQRTKPKKLRPLTVKPDVDALGYDPFENQPTLVHAASWRASVEPPTDFPLPLDQKKPSWLDSLPAAARAVLMAAAQPVDSGAPRIAGAIAQSRKE
jgi:hypothetical protein